MDKIFKSILNSYALVGFFAIFGLWLFFGKKRKDNEETILVNVDIKGSTLTDQQAKSYANICAQAMGILGTDEDALRNTLLPLTDSSFNHVYKQFGLLKGRTLVQWLVSELSPIELEPFRKFKLIP